MASIPETLPIEALPPPDADLIHTDGEPMDSPWHRVNMNVLIEQVQYHRRDERDYFVGGNMFIYFSEERVRNRDFRGPDFFYVHGVRHDPLRPYYAVWKEGGRYPNVIIELLSATTEVDDRTTKKDVYESVFHTLEYFLYDPDERLIEGFRHNGREYQRIEPDARGFLWCEELGLWLGVWTGEAHGAQSSWLRFFDSEGKVVPLFTEAERERAETAELRAEAERQRAEAEHQRAEAEHQRAEAEHQRAEAAEAEIARLKAMLERPTP